MVRGDGQVGRPGPREGALLTHVIDWALRVGVRMSGVTGDPPPGFPNGGVLTTVL